MAASVNCLRCHAQMEPGFIADVTHGGYAQENWSQGEPQSSFWRGLKVDRSHSIPVTTLRCPKCGYLESYAVHPPVSEK